MEGAIESLNLLNGAHETAGGDTALALTDVGNAIGQINANVANGNTILSQVAPPGILVDSWSLFDGATAAASTAASVTRDFSGFTTRAINSAQCKNNSGNIEILQAGTYQILRSARLIASDAELHRLDGQTLVLMYGGGGSGYRSVFTVSDMAVLTLAVGYQIGMRVVLYGGGGISISGSNGMIAIRKIA
jgi:hypothetical protein